MRDECRAPQFHFVAVVQHAIDFGGRIERWWLVAVLKVGLPARFNDRHVAVHDHVGCAGNRLDRGAATVVVPVRVTDEENPDIAKLESEFLDARPNDRYARLEIAVDEDEPLGSADEITREVFASDVVEIPRDAEWREWLRAIGVGLGGERGGV